MKRKEDLYGCRMLIAAMITCAVEDWKGLGRFGITDGSKQSSRSVRREELNEMRKGLKLFFNDPLLDSMLHFAGVECGAETIRERLKVNEK